VKGVWIKCFKGGHHKEPLSGTSKSRTVRTLPALPIRTCLILIRVFRFDSELYSDVKFEVRRTAAVF
jgi:hypothetical protein